MRHQLDPAIVRINGHTGTAVGLGVLVGPGQVLTCAHVVRGALGLPDTPPLPPDVAIPVGFPLLDGAPTAAARVFLWRPELDVAGLAMDGALPPAARPVAFVSADDLWGHPFRAFGFPEGRAGGVWAGGVLRGPQADGWLQIDTGPGGYHVAPGFSGGPVWDDALEGVVGLVTRADPKAGVRTAYVITLPLLFQAWPALAETSRPPSPYRGLAAFRVADAGNFFGREAYTAGLLAEAKRKPLLAVVGPSGSGKSSLVFAGLVPALRREGRLIIDFRPGREPFRALAAALLPGLEPTLSEVDRLAEAGKLAAALESGEVELAAALGRILSLDGTAAGLVLVVDQFEELYALADTLERQRRFLDRLLTLLANPTPRPFTLCLTLRADFMSQALAYRPFADALQDHDLKLGPMNRAELQAAVERPAARLNVAFEPGLVDRILDDVGQEPGHLPLLEFALTLLWERQRLGLMTHDAYGAIGQVPGALANHAEAVFERLSAEEQTAVRHIFVQLVQPGAGTADTRRLATREEVGEGHAALVRQLADARLLTTGGDERGRETVEVAHEALIQHWDRLHGWMTEERTFREWQERLRIAMGMWQASHWDAGALLRGALLADAEAWMTTRGERLPRRERQYISAGIAAREALAREEEGRLKKELAMVRAVAKEQARANRGLRRRSLLALAVAAVALFAVAGAFYFWIQTVRGQRLAEVREMAALSLEIMDRYPDTGMLLAYQMAQSTLRLGEPITAETYRALHTALTRLGQPLAVLKGHTDSVRSATFSPDGTHVITASDDGTTRLWNNTGQPLAVLEGYTSRVSSATFSPDAQRIVTASGITARLWDAKGQPLAELVGHTSPIYSAIFSPDGTRIVTTSRDATAQLWDDDGQMLAEMEGYVWVNSAAFSPDGTRIVTANGDGTARLWDGDGQPLAVMEGHTSWVNSAAFSPDGTRIVTASSDGMVRLWNGDGRPLAVLEGHSDGVVSAIFSPDGTHIVTASYDGTARLWDSDGQTLVILDGHTDWVNSATFSPDGTRIVTASRDGTARLWDGAGQPLAVLEGHTDWVNSAMFSPDGTRIVTASEDTTARLWDSTGQPLAILEERTNGPGSAAFSPDGTRIVTASTAYTARLWDGDGRLLAVLEGYTERVRSAFFSPDGTRILTLSWNSTPRLWDSNGQSLAVLEGHTDWVNSAAFSPDGTRIVTASDDSTARLWDSNGRPLAILEGHSGWVSRVAFSPDGARIVTAGEDGIVRLWDGNGQPLAVMEGHVGKVYSVAFSPDGTRIVTAGEDSTARLWDGNGQPLVALEGHNREVSSAAFSPDGMRIVTASGNTARLWDGQGQPLTELVGHIGGINSAAFSPDGRRIVTASTDGTARLWDGDGQPLAVLEGHTDWVLSATFSSDGTRILTEGWDGTALLWQTYASVEAMLAEVEQVLARMLPYEQCAAELGEALCGTPLATAAP